MQVLADKAFTLLKQTRPRISRVCGPQLRALCPYQDRRLDTARAVHHQPPSSGPPFSGVLPAPDRGARRLQLSLRASPARRHRLPAAGQGFALSARFAPIHPSLRITPVGPPRARLAPDPAGPTASGEIRCPFPLLSPSLPPCTILSARPTPRGERSLPPIGADRRSGRGRASPTMRRSDTPHSASGEHRARDSRQATCYVEGRNA